MSITTLLDSFASVVPGLMGSGSEREQQANVLVLSVWAWLNEAARRANELNIEWPVLDEAVTDAATLRVSDALRDVVRAVANGDEADAESRLTLLHREVSRCVAETENALREHGIEEQTIASLLLPLRRELTAWEVNRQSTEVLGRARYALSEVGGKKLALNFEEQFASDKKQADHWRQLGFVLFGLAVVWAITVYVALRGSDASTADVTARLAVGVSLIVFGGVAIRESGRHRADANVWRTVQLQLNTIDAYCSALPKERADILRFNLGGAVFAGPRLYVSATGDGIGADEAKASESGAEDGAVGKTRR